MEHIEARRPVCVRTAPLCAVIALVLGAGCVPKTEGLTEIFDDGHSYVEFPGKRVLNGHFTSFALDQGETGPAAIGIRDGRLVIQPFGSGECDAGVAVDFTLSRFYSFDSPDKVPKVPFLETQDEWWRGPLRFTDHSCNVSAMDPVSSANFPLFESSLDYPPEGYLVLSDDMPAPLDGFRRLSVCWPWDPAACLEVAQVRQLELGRDRTWSLELDSAKYALTGEPSMRLVSRRGTGWQEFGLDVSEFALERASGAVGFINPDGLSIFDDEGVPTPELIEPDACNLWSARGLLYSRIFSYRAPCETGPLVIYDLETKERVELAGDADPPVLMSYGERIAFYQTDVAELPLPADDNRFAQYAWDTQMPYVTGTLWAERVGSGTPVKGPERALLTTVVWLGNRAQVIADYDGTSGRLVTWDVDSGEITDVAGGVIDFGYDMVLSDFDGTTGVLRYLYPDRSTAVLAQGVPDRGSEPMQSGTCFVGSCFDSSLLSGKIYWSLLSDYDGQTGTLLLFSRDVNTHGFGPPEVIEHGVPLEGYRMLNEGDALLFLKNYDPTSGTGELNARFVPSADTFTVPGVDRFYEVSFPDPGVVYSVPEGGAAGVWYARLR